MWPVTRASAARRTPTPCRALSLALERVASLLPTKPVDTLSTRTIIGAQGVFHATTSRVDGLASRWFPGRGWWSSPDVPASGVLSCAGARHISCVVHAGAGDRGRRGLHATLRKLSRRRLDDGAAPPLIGQRFNEAWSAPNRTLDDLFFIIRSSMPKNAGGTLTPVQYAAVLAHMLERNGYRAAIARFQPSSPPLLRSA